MIYFFMTVGDPNFLISESESRTKYGTRYKIRLPTVSLLWEIFDKILSDCNFQLSPFLSSLCVSRLKAVTTKNSFFAFHHQNIPEHLTSLQKIYNREQSKSRNDSSFTLRRGPFSLMSKLVNQCVHEQFSILWKTKKNGKKGEKNRHSEEIV